MNGKILLDSTIAIDLLNGLEETRYLKEKIGKAKLYISIITRIELLSYSKLTPDDEKAIFIFLKSV
ncbi:MAG: hypothetical protein LBQ67_03070, partial [Treponema sp.]|nr:hypothetical protein [Treponema sp.]